jgi:HEAT repeat protein
MNIRSTVKCVAITGWVWLSVSASQAADRSVAELTRDLKSTNGAAQVLAIDELGAHGERAAEAVAPLTQLLKHKSAEVRAHAAHALGEIGPPAKAALPSLVELLKDADPTVRRQVAHGIMGIRAGPEVMVPLVARMLEESDPATQVRILQTIVEAGPRAVPGAIEALKNDKTAYWACLVLRDLGPAGKAAIPALEKRLSDSRSEVRREAALALAAMGSAAEQTVPTLTKALQDEHTAVAATYALARIGRISEEAEKSIRDNVNSDDKMLSTVSLWAMALTHPQDKQLRVRATEQLIERLKDPDAYVRVAAARGLAALPPAPDITLPIWERAMKDADETTLHHALDALALLGAPAVPRLLAGLKQDKLRPEIAQVLGQMGAVAAPATGALAALINDPDEESSHAAILALAKIGPAAKAAVPSLVEALRQPERSDTFALIYALGSIGPAAAAAKPALLEILADPKHEAAVVAAWALVKIDPSANVTSKTVPVLTSALTSSLPIIRRGAAEALGESGRAAKQAIPALERALKDSDPSVRDAAAKALAAIRR